MIQQYSAAVDRFGNAYALILPSQNGKMANIEYYLIFDDNGNTTIKGGVLEVETVLDQTLDTYVQEHVAESLPYMVIRILVDNHDPEKLEGMSPVVFTPSNNVTDIIKNKYPDYARLIAEKAVSDEVKAAMQ